MNNGGNFTGNAIGAAAGLGTSFAGNLVGRRANRNLQRADLQKKLDKLGPIEPGREIPPVPSDAMKNGKLTQSGLQYLHDNYAN